MTNKAFGNKADYTEITGREAKDLSLYMGEDDAQVFYMEQGDILAIVAPNCDDPNEIVCELYDMTFGWADTFEGAVEAAFIDYFTREAYSSEEGRAEDVVNVASYHTYFALIGGEPEDSWDFDFERIDDLMGKVKAHLVELGWFTEEDLDY